MKFTLTVDGDQKGLWYITSDDAVIGGRLLVTGHSLAEALAAVPAAMNDLIAAIEEAEEA